MKEGPDIARIAALIGDPARAAILTALMGGQALTATELAAEAGVTRQTASSHLARLTTGGLTKVSRQGRHRYVSLASDQVAQVLESLMGLAASSGHLRSRPGPREPALRRARVCYDHLAGEMGTQMMDAMQAQGLLAGQGATLDLTPPGRRFAAEFGLDPAALDKGRGALCRECLDWSERRMHLAGRLGRAMLARMVETGWARRDPDSRAVLFTPDGGRRFSALFSG